MLGEGGTPGPVQVPGEPGHPAEHLERLHVEVGPLGVPGGDEIVHLIAGQRSGLDWPSGVFVHAGSISLDIKSVAQVDMCRSAISMSREIGGRNVGSRYLPPVRVRWLTPGGWLAFQLPGNFDQPSHTILRDLASAPRWKPLLGGATLNRQAGEPGGYLALLAGAGCEVDAWETTYLHVLHGQDAVVDWYRGSGLRPVLAALPPALAEDFLAEYRDRIRVAYPAAPYGTVLPFRRVFVVARVRA